MDVDNVYDKVSNMIERGVAIKDIPGRYLNVLSTSSMYSNYCIWALIGQGYSIDDIPSILISAVAKDSEQAYEFCKNVIDSRRSISDIPVEILSSLSSDSSDFHRDAFLCLAENPCLSKDFIERIVENHKNSHEELDLNDIPFELFKSIIDKDGEYYPSVLNLAEYFIESDYSIDEIPQQLMDIILSDSSVSYFFVLFLLEEQEYKLRDIPSDLVVSLLRNRENEDNFRELVNDRIERGREGHVKYDDMWFWNE